MQRKNKSNVLVSVLSNLAISIAYLPRDLYLNKTMQICQYQCHDMSNSFLHIGMYARFLPFPKYLNHDMNHLFLQDSIYERCHMSSKLTAVLDLLDIKV